MICKMDMMRTDVYNECNHAMSAKEFERDMDEKKE